MIVVDASVWVSVSMPTDSLRVASRAWLATVVNAREGLAGPSLVLAEVAGAVARRTGSVAKADAAARRLGITPGLTLLPVDDALVRAAARVAADLGLRGADATYVAVARRLACPLVTWDTEMIAGRRAPSPPFSRPPSRRPPSPRH